MSNCKKIIVNTEPFKRPAEIQGLSMFSGDMTGNYYVSKIPGIYQEFTDITGEKYNGFTVLSKELFKGEKASLKEIGLLDKILGHQTELYDSHGKGFMIIGIKKT